MGIKVFGCAYMFTLTVNTIHGAHFIPDYKWLDDLILTVPFDFEGVIDILYTHLLYYKLLEVEVIALSLLISFYSFQNPSP